MMYLARYIAELIGWNIGQQSVNVPTIDQYCYLAALVVVVMAVFFLFQSINDIIYRLTSFNLRR